MSSWGRSRASRASSPRNSCRPCRRREPAQVNSQPSRRGSTRPPGACRPRRRRTTWPRSWRCCSGGGSWTSKSSPISTSTIAPGGRSRGRTSSTKGTSWPGASGTWRRSSGASGPKSRAGTTSSRSATPPLTGTS